MCVCMIICMYTYEGDYVKCACVLSILLGFSSLLGVVLFFFFFLLQVTITFQNLFDIKNSFFSPQDFHLPNSENPFPGTSLESTNK